MDTTTPIVAGHVVYAFSRREGACSTGGYHLRLDTPLQAGRMRRRAGEALCEPRRNWWGLERRPAAAVTCPRCLDLASRYGISVPSAQE